MLVPLLSSFTLLDFIALGLLLFAWVGAGLVIEHPPKSRASVTVLMRRYRSDWMTEMLTRKPRIFDATILGSLRQGTTFLTSAAMIAVGGVLALAGQPQTLDSLVMGVGIEGHPVIFWQTKLGVVALLLMHAVFKFIWSNRLFGYCAVVMASVPNEVEDPRAIPRARQAAEINIRAATNFNRGLRSVYFALAGLAWILGPWGLMLAVAVTGWSVLSREFASTSRGVLLED
ncbi:MAG: DUF599 domain-containing protein [Jannaschia helgolandensis]|jgi:uncharacterized membrane protein|uniref:Uncharacterized membrane protein n=1 Tax=Jannaschia helgolandensis TaxID=188906 RepID=A0A1H7QXP3_9RHOB|nr:DUF599 domain-containing protein [Jannaschia helgolandensis]SEL52746.1 Uncharacterized membrane protein [Jannaschia helgolandensis]|tara:strand:- start:78 stop:767 length:690 start_codon:yes stop_codon:yes gene_type:complete